MTDAADDAREGPGTANQVPDSSPVSGDGMSTCWHGYGGLVSERQDVGSACCVAAVLPLFLLLIQK